MSACAGGRARFTVDNSSLSTKLSLKPSENIKIVKHIYTGDIRQGDLILIQDEIPPADVTCVCFTIRRPVELELWKLAEEGLGQACELVRARAVPTVLLLLGLHDDFHAVRALHQQHEARVAEVGNSNLVAFLAQHGNCAPMRGLRA